MMDSKVAWSLLIRFDEYERPSHQKNAMEIAIATQVVRIVSECTVPSSGNCQVE